MGSWYILTTQDGSLALTQPNFVDAKKFFSPENCLKASKIGCANAHPAHPTPPPQLLVSDWKSLWSSNKFLDTGRLFSLAHRRTLKKVYLD